MIPLYSTLQFQLAKSTDHLELECERCHHPFLKIKSAITRIGKDKSTACRYCSRYCSYQSKKTGQVTICTNCGKSIYKTTGEISRTTNQFCSRSCAGTYNNTHKTTGNRRSKLEIYLEEQLITLYPNLEIHFNRKDAINSELDIYIPSLKLAFELNGIFHYEPIYGQDKLDQITNNDGRKFQACSELGISLCVIDTSSQHYFKLSTSKKFLDIITQIIETRLTI